jgi:N-acetylmuramoyl-L-alanine amidase
LHAHFGIDVSLTRREDEHLSNVERVAFANGLGARAFVSLHAGGLFDPERNIPSVFFLAQPTSEELSSAGLSQLRWWDQPSAEPPFVPWQLGSAVWFKQSRDLADNLHAGLRASYEDIQACTFEDGPRPARLAVLRGLLMPGVLVELGSLSSLETEQILHREGFQRRLAESLAVAVGNWIYGQEGRIRRDLIP